MDDFTNKRITIAGLGRFGGQIAAAKWLVGRGAKVLVTDQAPAEKLGESLQQLAGLPIEFHLGGHQLADFTSTDLIVTSPAISPRNEFLVAARDAGVPITTEIQLFIERCPAKILGVTGTKGKSTTTAMLGEMLTRRCTTWVGGNIGRSLLADLENIKADDLVVLELSSFMLEYLAALKWSPHVAVVTMIAADHLEWHGGLDAYVDAKANLLRFQTESDFAVFWSQCADKLSNFTRAEVLSIDPSHYPPFELPVPGQHNQINAQLAFAAASVMGVTRGEAQSALRDFRALPHRLELVHEAGGVKWINDSIATIPEAAIAALDSFPQGKVIQIVGGYDKHLPMDAMCDALAERAKLVLSIGAVGPALAQRVRSVMSRKVQRQIQVEECGQLERAVEKAKAIAQPGDVVLLSTGCASYDQFANFEKRGEEFARLARSE